MNVMKRIVKIIKFLYSGSLKKSPIPVWIKHYNSKGRLGD